MFTNKFLQNVSIDNIMFLKDINRAINLDNSSKCDYFIIPKFELNLINMFINNLREDTLYSVIPLISKYGKIDDPYLVLSRQFLVTRYSNISTITNWLADKTDIAITQFNIDELENHCLIFRYRKVSLNINKIYKY